MDPFAYPVMEKLFIAAFWTTPLFFLLQLTALGILLWRTWYRWRPETLGALPAERWVLQLGVNVAPVVMLFVSAVFSGGYQEERGHWFFHMHDGLAGLVLVPIFVAGSIVVGWGIARREYRLRSGTHWAVLITLLSISLWFAFATAFLGMTADRSMDLSEAAVVPAVAALNYALVALDIQRHRRQRDSAPAKVLMAWFSALAVSLISKVPLAMQQFYALPVEPPNGYGDCFVVGAATRGHPAVVGSRFDARLGRTVNRQWQTLRAFENRLARRSPTSHRLLRRLYNRIGPPIAAQIRSPLVADIVFLLLKPVEWLAGLYLGLTR